MGLFSKVKDAQKQAQDAMAGMTSSGMGAGGMGGQELAGAAAQAQLYQRIAQVGVEAPGVIEAMRPTGGKQFGGGTPYAIDVVVTPPGGSPYATTIQQSLLAAQLEGLSEGQAVTVKYDPENPGAAVLYSW